MKKIIFLLFFIGLTGCIDFRILDRWQSKMIMAEYKRESKAYYDKETPEQKELRKKNGLICRKLDELPENRAKSNLTRDMIFDDCMKERGSPVF